MASINQRVEIWQGDTLAIVLPVTDEVGAELNIETATVRFWVALRVDSTGADIKIQKSTTDGITVAGSYATVSLVSEDTDTLPAMSYYMEAEVEFPGSEVSTVMTGRFVVRGSLIR